MTSENLTSLLFLALLPSADIQQTLTGIKLELANQYQSAHALKSPPHITLFPPFRWSQSRIGELECLENFCRVHAPVPITLDGFGSFPPKVIFVKPRHSHALLNQYLQLQDFLKDHLGLVDPMTQKRSFTPHITVANRDLTAVQFPLAWAEFQKRSLHISFIATHLTLLQHNGSRWEINREWPFRMAGSETN